jgi:glycosyltransferase involved in cell wall biosynthesis
VERSLPTASGRPALTIGMPVYNGERFLREAIDSILAQTFEDFVLVVSDNASTDRTLEIVKEYAVADPRVVLLREETNQGAAWNFNRVFAECRTPFFKWASSDDVLAPTCVERCLAALADAPSVVLSFPRTAWIDDEGKHHGVTVDAITTPEDAPAYKRLSRVVGNIVYGNVPYAVIRSDAMRRTRLHGNYPSADIVLIGELALVGAFREVPEVLFYRRDHEGMSWRSNPSPEAISHWYDPSSKPVSNESMQVFRGYLAGIRHARLSPVDRALAYAAFLAVWTRRRGQLRTRARRLIGKIRP